MDRLTWRAALTANLIGLFCACVIWILQPLNNFLLRNSHIADSYLPAMGVGMVFILTLAINPLLRWRVPRLALSTKQLGIVFAIILVACTSTAIVKMWPHSLARSNSTICTDRALADAHKEMDLPDSLYIEPVAFGAETPACTQFNVELDEGNTIPWSAWIGPTLSWGSMLAFSILVMVGLALIVFPQWRDNERLPFPLLTLQRALIERPDSGRLFPPVFSSGLFWGAAIVVAIIYVFRGLNHHTGDAFPGFKLGWGLWSEFSGIWVHLHWWVKSGRIIFAIIGITYFVPNRVASSIWITVIAYQFYRMLGMEYTAPFHDAVFADQRNGAVLGVSLVILWLGRNQWLAVAKAMFRPARNDVDRRNRTAGLVFCTGCIGLLAWQIWAGNSPSYALLAVVMVVITTLVLARIVAETGIPVMGNSLLAGSILSMLPISWLSSKAIYLTNSVDMVIAPSSSQVSAAVSAMHGLGLDKEAEPKRLARMAVGFCSVTVVGILVAGAAHLWMGYNFPAALDGRGLGFAYQKEYNIAGAAGYTMDDPVKQFGRNSWGTALYSRIGHTVFGAILGIVLQIACLLSPLWPVHPVGLLIMDSIFIRAIWPSVFLGWAIKRAIVMYGGAKAYRRAKPLFLGLILGEVVSAILWAVVPAVLIWMGGDAAEVGHINI